MSSMADKIREKADRLKAQQATRDSATAEDRDNALARPLSSAAGPHTKPIRSTVDLSPARHASLKTWCQETAVEIGESRITTQDVLRVLVARLLTDETLARKIRADLRVEKQ
jgi:hypothetical protein